LTHLSCRYQNQPRINCQEPSLEEEEENFTQNPPPRRVLERVRVFQPTNVHSTHYVLKGIMFSVHSAHCVPKRIMFIVHYASLRLCLNSNPHTFPEFQNFKSFCDDLKGPRLQNLSFMKFVNALHLDSFPI